jgi:metallo-beta-lactamase class B
MNRVPRRRMRGTLGSALAGACVAASHADAQLTLRLTGVPPGTPAGAPIYVAGTFNGWNPASPAHRMLPRGGEYVLTLDREVRGPVEFKFTRGSWDHAEADEAGRDVANRVVVVPDTGAATYTGAVASWVDPTTRPRPAPTASRSVTVLDTAFAIPQLGRTRRVWLYLPPDYATSGKRYPVLYMHDGQNLFDNATAFSGEWGVDEALDSLHARGDRGVIVVGVDNGGQRRLDEYSPWKNDRFGGGDGAAYVEFLARTLKPYVDARYRTLPEREHTGVMGSSMGGLISLYAGLRHPEVFGRVGVFSPSLWFSPLVWPEARSAQGRRLDTRFYFLSGGLEGPQTDPGIVVEHQRRMVDTLAAAGFQRGRHLREESRPDGRHAEWFWKREFADAYRWLFRD